MGQMTIATKVIGSPETGNPEWVARAISALVDMLISGEATVVMGFVPTSDKPVAAVCFNVQTGDNALTFKGPLALLMQPGGNTAQFMALNKESGTQEVLPADAVTQTEPFAEMLRGIFGSKPGGGTIH